MPELYVISISRNVCKQICKKRQQWSQFQGWTDLGMLILLWNPNLFLPMQNDPRPLSRWIMLLRQVDEQRLLFANGPKISGIRSPATDLAVPSRTAPRSSSVSSEPDEIQTAKRHFRDLFARTLHSIGLGAF
jgi:hypothetical protein